MSRTSMKVLGSIRVFACLLSLICLINASQPAWRLAHAQSSATSPLSAVVRDRTGGRIPGARVRIYGAASATALEVASADGRIELDNLSDGTYVVEISAAGFQTQSQRLTLPSDSDSLEWVLEIAGIHQSVNVLATGLPEIPEETAKSVTIITREELRARDVVTLTDALRSVPGLQLQQLGGPAGIASFRFRGLRPEDAAIQLDGFRLSDPSDNKGSARSLLSEISAASVDRVEVLRGAASSLYGTHAIGGVVNVQTRQPDRLADRARSGFLSLEGGSLGLLLPSAGVSGWTQLNGSRRMAYSLNLTHQNYLSGQDGQDASRDTNAAAATWIDISPRARLFARFLIADGFAYLNESPAPLANLPALPAGTLVREAQVFPYPQGNFYSQLNDPDYHQRVRFYSGAARLEFAAGDFWRQSAGFQSLRVRRGYDDGPGIDPLAATLGYREPAATDPGGYDSSYEQLFWRNALAASGSDTLHFGVEYDRTAIDQLEFGQTTVASQKTFALQARNHARLFAGRLQIQIGGQAQFYALTTPEFSAPAGTSNPSPYTNVGELDAPTAYTADASLAYLVRGTRTKFRSHAGNGFRSPSLYERYGSGGRGFYYGNPLLKAERTNFIDVGVDQQLWRDRLELSATWFYTRLHTIIDFGGTPNDPFGRFFGYVNTRGGIARGTEFMVRARPHRMLSINAGYTLANSDLPFATAAGTTRAFAVSDHQFNAGVLVEPTRRLHFHLQTYTVSNHDFPLFGSVFPFPSGVYRFAGYARLDLTASADLLERESHTLRYVIRVDNLLNEEYYNAGFLAPKATLRTGLRWEF